MHHTPPLRLDFKGLRIQTTGSIDHLEVVLVLLVGVVSVCFFAVPSCLLPHVRKFEIWEICACGIRNTVDSR